MGCRSESPSGCRGSTCEGITGSRERRRKYQEAVARLAAIRDDLVGARQATIWAATYGTTASTQTVPTASLAAGLAEPVRRTLRVEQQLPIDWVWAALNADATVLRSVGTHEQRAALGEPVRKREAAWQQGEADLVGPRFDAAWAGTPEEAEQANKAQRYAEAVRRRLWGDS